MMQRLPSAQTNPTDHLCTMEAAKPKPPGLPRNTTIYTDGVDPVVVALRTEQVRQGLSDYALGLATGIGPQKLGKLWRGTAPSLPVLRRIYTALRERNSKFTLNF